MGSKDSAPGLPGGDWRRMLTARPVRNLAARVEKTGDETRVEVPRLPSPYRAPLSWIVRPAKTRTLKLDPLGAEVWGLCDGERTIEEILDIFARDHRLTFHESRVAVTGYFHGLVRRGALAVAIADEGASDA